MSDQRQSAEMTYEQLQAENRELKEMLWDLALRYKCLCIKHGEQPPEDSMDLHKATFMAREGRR